MLRSNVIALASATPFVANVANYGAVPDGVTDNTLAIQSAVAAIAANGGGTLYFPPTASSQAWLASPFNLTSNAVLYIDNCTIRATGNFSHWPVVAPLPSYGRGRDFPGPRYQSFIGCANCTNVTVTGNPQTGPAGNVIDGQGAAWWYAVKHGQADVTPGHLVETMWASNVEVSHITLLDSPFWNLHIWATDTAWVHDMWVRAPHDSLNTDGIDPDSSTNVVIERVDVSNGDDCIAVKSGWNQAGVAYGMPTRGVIIRDMTCTTGGAACLAIGSEMSGSVYDVYASNITCYSAGEMLNVKSCMGRGGVVSNITLVNSRIVGGPVSTAIQVADNYDDKFPPAPIDPTLIPQLGNVNVINVTAEAGADVGRAGLFAGLGLTPAAGLVNGVNLVNVDMSVAKDGWTCQNVTGTASNILPAPCHQLGPA